MTDLVTIEETQILAQQDEVVQLVAVAEQGPPGPQGPQGIQGPVGDAGGALLVTTRLSEFTSEEAKAEARANIGLSVIDGGTFF